MDVLNLGRRQRAVFVAVDDSRRVGEQGVELAAGARVGEGLERETAREHQRDDRTRGVLAHDERRGHGEQGDDVHPGLAAAQVADDGEGEWHEHHGGGRRPEEVGGEAVAHRPGGGAGEDSAQREADEKAIHLMWTSSASLCHDSGFAQSDRTETATLAQALFM